MELATLLVDITTLLSVIITAFFAYKNFTRRQEVNRIKDELLELYLDVNQLLQIEADLLDECGLNKSTVRKPYTLSKKIEPKHVDRRIYELEKEK